MKKVYINPKIVVELLNTHFLCVSIEGGGNGDGRPAESKGYFYPTFEDDDTYSDDL